MEGGSQNTVSQHYHQSPFNQHVYQEALGLENGFRVRLREDGLLVAFVLLLLLAAVAAVAIAKCCSTSDGKRTKKD